MKIVITGGAGYIGSHVVIAALDNGYEVTVFDDLSTANKSNINPNAHLIKGSTKSEKDLSKLFENDNYDGLIHLAANKASAESMKNPIKYTKNNIIGSLNLLNSCIKNNIKYFIFSSSAAVYGIPQYNPVDENHPTNPVNYYGYSKLLIEKNLKWYSKIYGLKYVALRYFNAAGYDINKRVVGKEIRTENLIPSIMEVAKGRKPFIPIYGNNYATRDGTGVRDYVHVSDIAIAHLYALEYLKINSKNSILNLGSETGFSVLEIIEKSKQLLNIDIPYKFESKRNGDVSEIVSSCYEVEKLLKWEKKNSDLKTIIESTWQLYS